jgi:sec-independent protein translocase protein TatB
MPSLGDSAVIIFLGLLLFGPKGLAQIARQLGKLMGEFRRASNEFRMQMEEELRLSEQADRQKEIAKIEAAAPPSPALPGYVDNCPEDHPHLRALPADTILDPVSEPDADTVPVPVPEPVPIATSGELSIMPPATGLPMPRSSSSARASSLGPLIDSVPHVEASYGHVEPVDDSLAQKPMRYTNHVERQETEAVDAAAEESVHG